MSTPTTNPVPSTDPNDLLFNAEKLDQVVSSSDEAYTDRLGVSRKTIAGAIATIVAFNSRGAWAPATVYAVRDLVVESGTWYACVVGHISAASFATDEASKWRVHQGVTGGELAAADGVLLVRDAAQRVDDVAAIRALAAPTYSTVAIAEGYSDIADGGGGAFAWDASSTATDDGGLVLTPVSAPAAGRWRRLRTGPARTLREFGAVGDGTTDDTVRIQAALDSGEKALDGGGLTYLVSAALTGSANTELRNFKLTAPTIAADAAILSFTGTDGTPQTLAANYAEGVFGMTVPNGAAFTVNGWAWLASEEYWAAAAGDDVKYGEFVQVTAITGNVLTFGESTLLAYTTAKSATITPVALMDNIRLINVNTAGPTSPGGQISFKFDRCSNVLVEDCDTEDLDYVHLWFKRSVRCTVRGGSGSRTGDADNLDYGVVVGDGCFDVLINGYRGDSMRHLVSIGGSQGVSRHITAMNCRGTNLIDAGMDAHSAVHEHTYAYNFLHFSDTADTTVDGILTQGSSPLVVGNQIYNPLRHGIFWQPETLAAFTGPIAGTFTDNRCDQQRNTGSTSALNVVPVSLAGVAPVNSVNITNHQGRGFSNNILVQTTTAAIKAVSINQAKCLTGARSRAIYINAAGADIDGVEINGGYHETDAAATNPVIELAATSPYYVKNWRVIAPHMKRGAGGTIGLRLIRTSNGTEIGSTTDNVTTKYSVDADSTGYTLDTSKSSVVTVTNDAYTVLPQDRYIVANRLASTVTLTLPDATKCLGRELTVKTIEAQTVVSASSNVAPITSATAGTAILAATDGAWALLKSDGANWLVMQRGT